MDKELIERLTAEAVAKVGRGPAWRFVFARLLAEECAKIAADCKTVDPDEPNLYDAACDDCAATIRESFGLPFEYSDQRVF